MTVKLKYTLSSTDYTRTFNIYYAKFFDVDYARVSHDLINGGNAEDAIGYKYVMEVDFQPLGEDKDTLFWLYGFHLGTQRQITYNVVGLGDVTRGISIRDSEFLFIFQNQTKFADGFKMIFVETGMNTITDDGSTRTIIPVYTSQEPVLSGNNLTLYADLVDTSSVVPIRKKLKFADETEDDISFAYKHKFNINAGLISTPAIKTWLTEYMLWGVKHLDTTQIDGANGQVFRVVFDGKNLRWKEAVKDTGSIDFKLVQRLPYTIVETYTPPVITTELWGEKLAGEGVWGG